MAALTSLGETSMTGPAAPAPRGMQRQPPPAAERLPLRRLHPVRAVRAAPLLALLRFSLEGSKLGTWSLAAWKQIVSYPGLPGAVALTLELAVITSIVMVVLLVPTMIWIKLRVQWFSRTFEFLCLLPLTIPAIVLVVGLGPVYNRIQHYSLSALQLFWVYVVLALPYAYRALSSGLDAIDVGHPGRGRPEPGRELVHRDVPGHRAEHVAGHPERAAADRRPGPGRVHHRVPAALQHAAADPVLHQPQHAERRGLFSTSMARCCSPSSC